ncbi:MAG: translation initiation factor IF-2 N-terminal domain-containing protein, partial [Solirubrobacteraceae bacterium]
MSKKRVHEIAKEQGIPSKDLLEKLNAAGVAAKAAASSVEEADALRVLADRGSQRSSIGRNGTPAGPATVESGTPNGSGASSGASSSATVTTAKPAPPSDTDSGQAKAALTSSEATSPAAPSAETTAAPTDAT